MDVVERGTPAGVRRVCEQAQVGERLAERHTDLKMRDVGPPQKIQMAIGIPRHGEIVRLETTSHIEPDLKSTHLEPGSGNQSRLNCDP